MAEAAVTGIWRLRAPAVAAALALMPRPVGMSLTGCGACTTPQLDASAFRYSAERGGPAQLVARLHDGDKGLPGGTIRFSLYKDDPIQGVLASAAGTGADGTARLDLGGRLASSATQTGWTGPPPTQACRHTIDGRAYCAVDANAAFAVTP